MATAPITPIGTDGRTATVVVPRLATSGAVSLTKPGAAGSTVVKIDSWRNTNDLSWVNSTPFQSMDGGYNLADLDAIFGEDQTRIVFLGHNTEIPSPWAGALIAVLDKYFEDDQCFGMALAAEKLKGPQLAGVYPSWAGGTELPGNDAWHLTGPGLGDGHNDSPALARYVHRMHVVQTGLETIAQWAFYRAKTAGELRRDITNALHAGGALLSMNSDHVVTILDVRDGSKPGEAFLIDTYDPNVPFAAGSGTPDENETTGGTHNSQLDMSTATVNSNNTIHFNDGKAFDISVSDVTLLPMSLYTKRPTIPGIPGLIDAVLTGFGFGTAVTQVTDERGRTLFRPDGSLNADPATRIANLKPFPGTSRLKGSARLFAASAKMAYTYTLTGKGSSYDAHAIGPGYAVQLDGVPSQVGVVDQLRIAPAEAAFEFRTTGAPKAFHGRLIVHAPDKHARTAVVSGTSFSTIRSGWRSTRHATKSPTLTGAAPRASRWSCRRRRIRPRNSSPRRWRSSTATS